MSTDQESRPALPGFGLPIWYPKLVARPGTWMQDDLRKWKQLDGDQVQENTYFAFGLDGRYNEGPNMKPWYTERYCHILRLVNTFTDLPNWHHKINDSAFVKRWWDDMITEEHADINWGDWIVEELKYQADRFRKSGFVVALDGGVFKSDHIISSSTRRALSRAASSLLVEPDRRLAREEDKIKRDTLRMAGVEARDCVEPPQITPIVDPYLFPLTFGETRAVREHDVSLQGCVSFTGKGGIVLAPSDDACDLQQEDASSFGMENAYSNLWQWLPCEVRFGDGKARKPEIISYINNVHPQTHRDFYLVLEDILDKTITLFNSSLAHAHTPEGNSNYYRMKSHRRTGSLNITSGEYLWQNSDLRSRYDIPAWVRRQISKNVGPLSASKEGLCVTTDAAGLQIVVQLLEVNLDPDAPQTLPSMWTVEGQWNERICASSWYCFDRENIGQGSISFEQWGRRAGGDHAKTQKIGMVKFQEGRLITFPNMFRTRLEQFSLADRSRPGHCKLLSIRLVEPRRRILSTLHVPCQRRDWWKVEMETVWAQCPALGRLPREIFDLILKFVTYPKTVEDERWNREDYMDDVKNFQWQHELAWRRPPRPMDSDYEGEEEEEEGEDDDLDSDWEDEDDENEEVFSHYGSYSDSESDSDYVSGYSDPEGSEDSLTEAEPSH